MNNELDDDIKKLQLELLELYRKTDDYERTTNLFLDGKLNFGIMLKFSPESTAIYERLLELTKLKYCNHKI